MFLARIEALLALYAELHDPARPVICFDERPCFLSGETVAPLPLQHGQDTQRALRLLKHSSCTLLALEPLTGQRLGLVRAQRTKKEYTEFCQALVKAWPGAKKIRLVQDNLNTHNASSFYEHLSAEEARALAEKFEFHYTPKVASWLNMIEIEFSALARECLHRRIPTQEVLEREVLTLIKERAEKQIKIKWQFSLKAAREKMNSHYTRVNAENSRYKKLSFSCTNGFSGRNLSAIGVPLLLRHYVAYWRGISSRTQIKFWSILPTPNFPRTRTLPARYHYLKRN